MSESGWGGRIGNGWTSSPAEAVGKGNLGRGAVLAVAGDE